MVWYGFGMEHTCDLAERIGDLLLNEKYSDVVFIVDGEQLPAHRAILATSSEYFKYKLPVFSFPRKFLYLRAILPTK